MITLSVASLWGSFGLFSIGLLIGSMFFPVTAGELRAQIVALAIFCASLTFFGGA